MNDVLDNNEEFNMKGKNFSTILMNASGVRCTDKDELDKLEECQYVGAIITKSCTLMPREGNEKPRYYYDGFGSINSTGLANRGIEYYIKLKYTKPYIISIASVSQDPIKEIDKMLQIMTGENIDGIEINVSCPNIKKQDKSGSTQSKNDTKINIMERLISMLNMYKIAGKINEKIIGLKLAPIIEYNFEFKGMCEVLKKASQNKIIDYIVCCNSMPNGYMMNEEMEDSIKPNEGLGGIGGNYIRPTAMANVKKFRKYFDENGIDIKIIACGGISEGKHIDQYKKLGADACQIGTHFMEYGIECFKKLIEEYAEIKKLKNNMNYKN